MAEGTEKSPAAHRPARQRAAEAAISLVIRAAGLLSVVIVALIFLFLFLQALPVLRTHSLAEMLFGTRWQPVSTPPRFGLVPLLAGSFLITATATLIALPLGLATAIYLAELASPRTKAILKPAVEMLAAVPSVVLGFIGLTVLAPIVKKLFGIPTGLTGFTAAVMLAYMALPTIVSIADDAIRSVPDSIRLASLALGTTRWQTIRRAVLPAARSGIIAAVLLGIGRAIGETMTVLMVSGNAPVIPRTLLQPMRTMTATIAAEMGEAPRGTPHFHALFMVGAVLFVISFLVNLTADMVLRRGGAGR